MPNTTYEYPAVKILESSSGRPLVLLAAPATEIGKWAGVPQKLARVDDGGATELLGFQREQDPDRIQQIASFYGNPNNVLQDPLLCALRLAEGTEVSFEQANDASSKDGMTLGCLRISFVDKSGASLLEMMQEAKGYLEARVPGLRGRPMPASLIDELRTFVNSGAAEADSSGADVGSNGEPPLEEALLEQSYVTDFWDQIAARIQVLTELGSTAPPDGLIGFSREALKAYLSPIVLVDGQHRLGGALLAAEKAMDADNTRLDYIARRTSEGAQPVQITDELLTKYSRLLPISLLLDDRPDEHVFQFVVVNQKATPVRKALLGTIISTSLADSELDRIAVRLDDAGIPLQSALAITYFAVNPQSPFCGLVSRGFSTDGNNQLPWSVLGQLVAMFRELRGAKYFHDAKMDYADVWKRRYLEKSGILDADAVSTLKDAEEAWSAQEGPWKQVFVEFWTAVRDKLASTDPAASGAANYWGNPRSSNLFNKPMLQTLATDFFAYLVESRRPINEPAEVTQIVEDWLLDVNAGYFNRDWKLENVKKDATGTRKQWSSMWYAYRRDPKALPSASNFSRTYRV